MYLGYRRDICVCATGLIVCLYERCDIDFCVTGVKFVCLTGVGFVNSAELVKYRMQGDHDWSSGHCEMSTGESDQLSLSLSSCTEIKCENNCVGIRINQLTGTHKGA